MQEKPARAGGMHLKRLSSSVKSLALICRMLLVVAGRFWHWRLELWRHPERLMESKSESMKRTLLFIRHGQTMWNVERILPGQLAGVALTETGRAQAARLGEALKVLPITAVISSPLERARDTAAYISGPHGLPVLIDEGLMDTDIGPWAGKNVDELFKSDPGWKEYVRDPTQAPEGIETFFQVQQRAVAAVERWLGQETVGNYLAFVAHADVVKLLLAYYMGLDAAHAGWLAIDNASVSIVKLYEEYSPRIVAIGWSPQPGWLQPPISASVEPSAD